MKTGIIYISKHGTTEKVARIIADNLHPDETQLINLGKEKIKDIETFDRIIIGGSIHMASVHKKTKKACEIYKNILMTKKLGLFLCCMEKGEKSIEQLENAFSEDLRKHATSIALLGYEYNFDKMNCFEKALVKKIAGSKKNISEIDYDAISIFITELKKEYRKPPLAI